MILPYVYKLTHKITGQFYIGYREANKIKSDLDLPIYQSSSNYVKEIGFCNFNWGIIAEFFNGDDAYEFEQICISDSIKNPLCLNKYFRLNGVGQFKRAGVKLTDETKAKLKIANLGKIISDETKDKISKGGIGLKRSEQTKMAISKALTGKIRSADHIAKTRRTGSVQSDETRAKISAAKLGKKRGPYNKRQGK